MPLAGTAVATERYFDGFKKTTIPAAITASKTIASICFHHFDKR
jgi:hypothetical protein